MPHHPVAWGRSSNPRKSPSNLMTSNGIHALDKLDPTPLLLPHSFPWEQESLCSACPTRAFWRQELPEAPNWRNSASG